MQDKCSQKPNSKIKSHGALIQSRLTQKLMLSGTTNRREEEEQEARITS